jgi:hypothetical protein
VVSRSAWARAALAVSLLWTGLVGPAAFATSPPYAVETKEPSGTGYREVSETPETFPDEGVLKATLRAITLVPNRGYTPIQVTAYNASDQPRPVRLSIQSQGRVMERTLRLGPRERAVTWLMMPADLQSGVLTMESPGVLPASNSFYLDSYRGARVMVLGDVKTFEAETGLARVAENQEPLLATRFVDPAIAPRELSAYAGYDAVLVTSAAEQVPDDVWAVLETFALSGGNLVLANPPANLGLRFPLLPPQTEEASPYGFGQVRQFRDCKAKHDCGTGLGEDASGARAMVVPAGPAARWMREDLLRDGRQPLLTNARAPVGRFLLLIFLFTLAVGPGGLMLARRKGPLSVLIAVPSLAALTCLALVAWSVLVDGFRVHAARYSLTLLDRERSRAVMVGLNAWYANLAADGVDLPASSVLLAPQDAEDAPRSLDWTNGLALRNQFLPSRTYREWGELAVIPSRARLTVSREGEGVRIQNALGAPLKGGVVKLGGQLWEVPELADGAEGLATSLLPEGEDLMGVPHEVRNRFPGAMSLMDMELREGDFLARLSGKGFTPTAVLDVDLDDSLHLVRGHAEEARR